MLLHHRELLIGELPCLIEHLIGNLGLADIVQQARNAKFIDLLFVESMLLADDHCHRRHINAVLKRVLVANFQRADIHSDRVIVRDRLHQIICNAAGRRGKAL